MTEKYKIYLSEDLRARLSKDAKLFGFSKKNGSVNLNSFLKTLIVNYFSQYRYDSERLYYNLSRDIQNLVSVSESDSVLLADKIIRSYLTSDDFSRGLNRALTLTVSGTSYDIIRTIESNLLKDMTLSQYIKNMFLSYLSMPVSFREAVIFKQIYDDILLAIEDQFIISFMYAEDAAKYSVEPYFIAPSRDEGLNYLLCVDTVAENAKTFKISEMQSVFVTSAKFEIAPTIKQELNNKSITSFHINGCNDTTELYKIVTTHNYIKGKMRRKI